MTPLTELKDPAFATASPIVLAHRNMAIAELGFSQIQAFTVLQRKSRSASAFKQSIVAWMLDSNMGREGRLGKPTPGEVAATLGCDRTTVVYHYNLAKAAAAARGASA